MPQGDKSKYTDKQKRQAEHIEEGYEDSGVSRKEAKSRAWATVNKESGWGKKSGSGQGQAENHSSSRKGGKKEVDASTRNSFIQTSPRLSCRTERSCARARRGAGLAEEVAGLTTLRQGQRIVPDVFNFARYNSTQRKRPVEPSFTHRRGTHGRQRWWKQRRSSRGACNFRDSDRGCT